MLVQKHKSKAERVNFVVMFALAIIFAAMAAKSALNLGSTRQASIATLELKTSAAEVIGPSSGVIGTPSGQYTLVEFGDYQCPPCHRAAATVSAVRRRYRTKLRFVFRNLPLTSIHPNAMRAAIVAESSRESGDFWEVHDALYHVDVSDFDDHALDEIVRRFHVAPDARAATVVNADVRDAGRFGITGVPAFLLCTPSGRTFCVPRLEQLGDYLDLR